MISTYQEGLSIDRINNNGNYEKNNCRWTTQKEQVNNSRTVFNAQKFLWMGSKFTIAELSELYHIKRSTLWMRLLKYNWPIEKALT